MHLAKKLGKPWTDHEFDAMMHAVPKQLAPLVADSLQVTLPGEARRIDIDKFCDILNAPVTQAVGLALHDEAVQVAWDEPDMYPCQREVVEQQAREKLEKELRVANSNKNAAKKKTARTCVLM
eukprot:767074-Hanusia_phi.AAC.1